MPAKKAESPPGSREKLLAAAEALFAEQGFDGARVEEIASRAGVNIRMLYHHFGSKGGLFQAVVNALDTEIIERQDRVLADDAEPQAILRRMVEDIWDFLTTRPNFVRIAAWMILQRDRLADVKSPGEEYALNVIRPRMDEMARLGGWNPAMDPTHVMLLCWSLPFLWCLDRNTFERFARESTSEAKDRSYREFMLAVLEGGLHAGARGKKDGGES